MEEQLALPSEALANAPYVQIRGKRSVSVENHRGVLEYTDEAIVIAVKHGKICVQGDSLRISSMHRKRIEVRGTIFSIGLE